MIIYSWLLIVCCDWLLQQQQRSGRQKAMRHSGLFWQVSCSEAHSLRPLVDLYQVSSHYSHRVIILSSTCVCLSLSSSLSLGRRPRIPLSDVCAYNAGDTHSRNTYQKLSRVSVNLVPVFVWYKFLARNWTQLYSGTETVRRVTRTVQRNWPDSCFGARKWRNCDELASNFSCKCLVAVSRACVASITGNNTKCIYRLNVQQRLFTTGTGDLAMSPPYLMMVCRSEYSPVALISPCGCCSSGRRLRILTKYSSFTIPYGTGLFPSRWGL